MRQRINNVLGTLGIKAPPDGVDRLMTYVSLVMDQGKRLNLTGAKSANAYIDGPLFDALTVVTVWQGHEALLDVGSGGGLPGVPLACTVPGVSLTLCEPRGKRADFLRCVVGKLGLDAEVTTTQDRELPAGGFEAAVAQAVFSQQKWIKRGRRLVGLGGAVYLLGVEGIGPNEVPTNMGLVAERRFSRDGRNRTASVFVKNG